MTQKFTHKHTQLYDCTTRLHHQAKHNMRPTITDVLWSVCVSIGRDCEASRAETAEPTEMKFGLWACGKEARSHVLGVLYCIASSRKGRGNFCGGDISQPIINTHPHFTAITQVNLH